MLIIESVGIYANTKISLKSPKLLTYKTLKQPTVYLGVFS